MAVRAWQRRARLECADGAADAGDIRQPAGRSPGRAVLSGCRHGSGDRPRAPARRPTARGRADALWPGGGVRRQPGAALPALAAHWLIAWPTATGRRTGAYRGSAGTYARI